MRWSKVSRQTLWSINAKVPFKWGNPCTPVLIWALIPFGMYATHAARRSSQSVKPLRIAKSLNNEFGGARWVKFFILGVREMRRFIFFSVMHEERVCMHVRYVEKKFDCRLQNVYSRSVSFCNTAHIQVHLSWLKEERRSSTAIYVLHSTMFSNLIAPWFLTHYRRELWTSNRSWCILSWPYYLHCLCWTVRFQ